jgi:transcriptional regulator with XRE-family HTH domain
MSNMKKYDPKREAVRKILKDRRIELKLTQTDLADRLDKPQSYVAKYESGERNLDFVDVYELCNSLKLTLHQLSDRFLKMK